ncbi:hypothetical protein WJX74_005880 [Apatococcus lobatus]|uniref:THIF-type NAD/FAD binding fold domain-containing protein n=1 Tax=Apatococcus lobatus TaxID=904363 RepID=A0AAW1RUM8_9CHLO
MQPHRLQDLVLGAAVGAAAAVLVLSCFKLKPQAAPQPSGTSPGSGPTAQSPSSSLISTSRCSLTDEILLEQLTRNLQFFGEGAQQQLAQAFVIVIGLGGVGSHAAAMLLRSGIGKLRLIDFDQVSLSSLNRHAVATREDVGTPKALCLEKHFKRILPETEVDSRVAMYTSENEDQLLGGQPSFVLDAIDNIDTKVALLLTCKQRGIPVLSVAGAGAKADPTRIRVVDIHESSSDPLARAVRHRLKRKHGIADGIPILLSTEKPLAKLMDVPVEDANPADYQIVPNFRVRTIPVLGVAPAAFGVAAASWILCQLAGQPFQSEPIFSVQPGQYETQLNRLTEREHLVFNNSGGPPVDLDDIIIMVREVWRHRSARHSPTDSKPDKGLYRSTHHLTLTRWDSSQEASMDNLILLTFQEAEAHEASTLTNIQEAEPAFFNHVTRVLQAVNLHYT